MNSMLKSFVDEHSKEFELGDTESTNFEHLINYITTRDYTSRHFDPVDTSLGKGEVGIDGVAIIVNDVLITSYQEVESYFTSGSENNKNMRDISVSLIFTQSKTSEHFDLSEFNLFLTSVINFIKRGSLNTNQKALEYKRICKYIFDHPTQLSKNPDCHIFYAFTGKVNKDKNADAVCEDAVKQLKDTFLLDDITITIYDVEKIVSVCRSIKYSAEKTIMMENCSVIPHIENVPEAFIGTVRCVDYVKLITNDDGALMSNLFEDNVRYFQGHNTVNAEIQTTLKDAKKQQAFSIFNNGVTIVAQEIRRTANKFALKNFQVVNGCQTSVILYENRNILSNESYIVVKLISSIDKGITDSIVKTTNRQTPVLTEAFETLRDFHKNLEDVYASYDSKYRLYYERRSKQYDSTDVNKNKVVSFPFQTAAYVAVFLSEPHSTHRYFGELLKSYKTRMYQDSDVLEQYCMASMMVYAVDKYLRNTNQVNKYRKYRFHIALLLRCLIDNKKLPQANSREMKKLCDALYSRLSNQVELENGIKSSIEIIDKELSSQTKLSIHGNDISRTKEFTNSLLGKIGATISSVTLNREVLPLECGNQFHCRVTGWNRSYVYVEIIDHKESGSVHISKIASHYVTCIDDELSINQEVKARIISDDKHPIYGYEMSII